MRGRRATIDLSHLTAEQALLLFEVLSDIASAIWEAHEPEIEEIAGLPTQADIEDVDAIIGDDPEIDDRLPF